MVRCRRRRCAVEQGPHSPVAAIRGSDPTWVTSGGRRPARARPGCGHRTRRPYLRCRRATVSSCGSDVGRAEKMALSAAVALQSGMSSSTVGGPGVRLRMLGSLGTPLRSPSGGRRAPRGHTAWGGPARHRLRHVLGLQRVERPGRRVSTRQNRTPARAPVTVDHERAVPSFHTLEMLGQGYATVTEVSPRWSSQRRNSGPMLPSRWQPFGLRARSIGARARAEAVARMGLAHAVVTAVARDDLPDGGAEAFAEVTRAIRKRTPAPPSSCSSPTARASRPRSTPSSPHAPTS